MRIPLEKIPVASMEASLPKNPAIAPGEKSPLVVQITSTDGKIYRTEGKGKGQVQWKDLAVQADVVSANKKGVLSLPRDPRLSDGKTGHVAITAPSHPGVQASLDIPLRYDYAFTAKYAGGDGMNGTDGTDGINGTDGSPGSMDPDNPSAGGNGSDGTNGTDGSNGGDGSDGPPVQVQVTLRPGDHPLLEAAVSSPGHHEHFYLIDPQGGSLTVTTAGGSGGKGGRGGRGGTGGSGGIGQPNGSSGRNGSSGNDGRNGFDGRGGQITVIYDPKAKPFLDAIRPRSPSGPDPDLQEQSVAPLW